MKKKIVKIIFVLGVLVLLFIFDGYQKKNETQNVLSIVQFKEDYKKDYYLEKKDLKVIQLPKELYQSNMILSSSFEAGYLIQEAYKDTFVYEKLLTDEPSFKLKEDQRLITVKCSVLQSNGWYSQTNDLVDLLMVEENNQYIIKDATVLKYFDQNLSSEGLAEYYTFIVTTKEAMMYYEKLKSSEVYIVVK